MCGIVGVFPLNVQGLTVDERTRRIAAAFIHNEILLNTLPRGKDATGIACSFGKREGHEDDQNEHFILKQPVPVTDFVTNDGTGARYESQDKIANLKAVLKATANLNRPLNHIIGHCRLGTKGSEYLYLNNHPIEVGNIVGIHNGGIRNADKLFDIYKST